MMAKKTTALSPEDRETIEQSFRELIIKLARHRAWEDHVASLETRRN